MAANGNADDFLEAWYQHPKVWIIPPPFALAPALAGADQPIDYSSRAGQTLYAQATAELPYTFEGKSSSLPAFLQAIRECADATGCDDIFAINIGQDVNSNDIQKNLLTQYCEITIENVHQKAQVDYIGQQNRAQRTNFASNLPMPAQIYCD